MSKANIEMKVIDQVGVITLDLVDKKVNTLSSKLIPEFNELLAKLEQDSSIKAAVILSGKKDCFIAGADIEELQAAQTEEDVARLSETAHSLFARLESMPFPVVCGIDGACLGGGLELALACTYRVASSNPKTALGLPEVMLGLMPGAGGTQRLPRLIGLQRALPLMLAGNHVKAERARKMGIVDVVVEPPTIEQASIQIAKSLSAGTTKRSVKKRGAADYLEKFSFGRDFIFKKARQSVLSKTHGLYPAPEHIIDTVAYGLDHGVAKGFAREAQEFAKLAMTPEAKGLISLYFAQTEQKKNPYPTPQKKIEQVAVLGAGLMGAGIAMVSAQKDIQVRLKDVSEESVGNGKKYIFSELDKRRKKGAMSAFERDRILSRIFGQIDYKNFDKCQLIVEAVFEDLDLKHRVLQEVEASCGADSVFASNTSAIPIGDIAKASKRPDKVLGLHYFSPVHKMPLLEIIKTPETSQESLGIATEFGLMQGKTVIVVGDGPGFYTTRILAPYMDEAALVSQEGFGIRQLDEAMQDFGFPVGPITLTDEVGLDVAIHVSKTLSAAFGERMAAADPDFLVQLVEAGCLGRKSGKGFFIYQKTGSSKAVNPEVSRKILESRDRSPNRDHDRETVQNRLAYRMMNEAAYCLEEGILSNPREGDVGAVFGLGYPPFTGGPFRHMDRIGVDKVAATLSDLAEKFGSRFKPCQMLVDMGKSGKSFFE